MNRGTSDGMDGGRATEAAHARRASEAPADGRSIDDVLDGESFLSEDDARRTVRLLGDVVATEGPIAARRRVLVEGLCGLIDADAWIWTTSGPTDDGGYMTMSLLHGGFTDAQLALIAEATQDPDVRPPEDRPLMELVARGRPFTRFRQQLLDDDDWYGHPHWERYRKRVGVDHFVYGIHPVDGDGTISGVGIHRRQGREPFTARERRIVHLVITEVPWLHEAERPSEHARRVLELSPRLRTVTMLLLEGHTRPAIAEQLGISAETVGGYVKRIYRHFEVHSRTELLRRFMAGDGGDLTRGVD